MEIVALRHALRATPVRVAIVVVLVLVAGTMCFGIPGVTQIPPYRIDLDVYRLGGQVWLQGGDLYGQMPDTQAGVGLPFTYPPIAAVLFAPLAWMPLPAAAILVGLTSVVSMFVVMWLVTRDLSDLSGPDLCWFTAAATTLMLLLNPVTSTFSFGQINLYLMLLVVVDVTVGRDRWWGGALTGLAAAIKLTPAVFFLYFLLRKDVRALVVGGVSFLAAHALGFLLAWDDSVQYWTTTLRDPSRIGGLAYTANQSINGFLHRFGMADSTAQVLWMVLVVGLVAFAAVLMVRLIRRGEQVAAVVVVALAGLFASPVSWLHHWVWIAPALVVCFWWALRGPEVLGRGLHIYLWVMAGIGYVLFVASPNWWLPHEENRELGWTWYMHIIGNYPLWWSLALMAGMWWFTRRTPVVASATDESPVVG